jgi:large subunit ribosomal protein L23Ae
MADKKEGQSKPRAQKFARLIKNGKNYNIKFRAYRAKPTFKRLNRSLRQVKTAPKYSRKSHTKQNTWDKYAIFKQPVTSERFYKKMETENTVIFFVDPKANKTEIKKAFLEAFNVKPQRINTLVTPLGRKKAYIKIPKTNEASEIANKIGLI